MKKILLLTHNDLDGLGCSLLFNEMFDNLYEIDTKYCSYNNINERFLKYKNDYDYIILTDICIEEEIYNKNKNSKLFIFDHHESRQFYKNDNCGVYSTTECGTSLLFKSLKNNVFFEITGMNKPDNYGDKLKRFKNFIDIIRDYDLFILKNPKSLDYATLYQYLGLKEFYNRFYNNKLTLNKKDKLIIEFKNNEKIKYVQQKQFELKEYSSQINGKTYKYAFGFVEGEYINDVAKMKYESNLELDFVWLIDVAKNKMSFRSNQNKENSVNVMEIAKIFNGGGHYNASGACLDFNELILNWLNKNYFSH